MLSSLKTLAYVLIALTILSTQVFASTSATSSCSSPTGFDNIIVRAPTPSSPKLQLKDDFLFKHILFFYTDQNTALSEAAFASFCLDQCIAYQPDPNATDVSNIPPVLPPYFVTNRTGPCLSFTVDMGKPFPPNPKDTAPRWYCEAFDQYLTTDDFVPIDAPGSFMYGLGVNRACEGGYRVF